MKLIRIEHDRCGEPDKYETYVVPDDMAEEEIRNCLDAAQDAYLARIKAIDDLYPEQPHPESHIDRITATNNMTIGEYREWYKAVSASNEELRKKKRELSASYTDELKRLNIVKIDQYKMPEDSYFVVSWGHNHGKTFDY